MIPGASARRAWRSPSDAKHQGPKHARSWVCNTTLASSACSFSRASGAEKLLQLRFAQNPSFYVRFRPACSQLTPSAHRKMPHHWGGVSCRFSIATPRPASDLWTLQLGKLSLRGQKPKMLDLILQRFGREQPALLSPETPLYIVSGWACQDHQSNLKLKRAHATDMPSSSAQDLGNATGTTS